MPKRLVLLNLAGLILLAACARGGLHAPPQPERPAAPVAGNPPGPSLTRFWDEGRGALPVAENGPARNAAVLPDSDPPPAARQRLVEIADGPFIRPPRPARPAAATSAEGDISLNFQGTDINEFVRVILSDLLNRNFVIDPEVRGSVTIETANPLRQADLFPLLEEILSINNAAIIESDGIYQILPRAKAARGNLSPLTADIDLDGGYSVRVVPLRYIAAAEMGKILEPFVAEAGELRIDKQRNMVIVGGTPSELARLQETIDIFDVDWLRGMSVGLYPLEHVSPLVLKRELDEILGGMEGGGPDQLLGGLVRSVALERLNSILLISSTPAALGQTETWVYRLDRPGERAGRNLYVYEAQNAKAVEIAKILSDIFDGRGEAASAPPALAPGVTPVEITAGAESETEQDAPTSTMAGAPAGMGGLNDPAMPAAGAVEIIADDTRNALVILATARDYRMIAAAIRKLDVVPLQVLIEASILEVTLSGELNYGVEWFFNNRIGRGRGGRGQLDLGAAGLSALAPGFSYTIVNSAANVRVALNALESESEFNVLSAPSLMVLDNQTATINVGDEIPVPSRQSTSNTTPNAPTVNEIQFRNTGITLEVTPRVNNSGLVTMEIRQEVSNAIRTTSSTINAPTIRKRQIKSSVAINSGQTIVLGGLIRDSENQTEDGIPLLHQMPVLGKLFGGTRVENVRTELVVLLTPRVVRNQDDAKKITDEFRKKLYRLPPPADAAGPAMDAGVVN